MLDSRLRGNDPVKKSADFRGASNTKNNKQTTKILMTFTTHKAILKNISRIASVAFIVAIVFVLSGIAQAATYTFEQTDWSGGASATSASHPTNQTSWTQFESKDVDVALVNSGTNIELTATSSVVIETSSTDFADGVSSPVSSTQIIGSGDSAYVQLNESVAAIKQIVSSDVHNCALKTDGTMYCWGQNSSGQLGDGGNTTRKIPLKVLGVGGVGFLTDIKQIAAGAVNTCAVSNSGNAYCWGEAVYGTTGDGTATDRYAPVQVKGASGSGFLTGVSSISTNGYSTCAVKTDGTLYCWGYNSSGQLGNGGATNSALPVQVKDVNGVDYLNGVAQVSNGVFRNTCALKTDGTAYCWGYNMYGAIGDNTTVNKSIPVQVLGVGGVGVLTNISRVVSGYNDTCAITTDGSVYCWGYNAHGQIGDNTAGANRLTPVQVHGVGNVGFLSEVTQISLGIESACALKNDGSMFCWGFNTNGKLGDNTGIQKNTPVQVHGVGNVGFLTSVMAISSGAEFSCAVKTNGTAYCWGLGTSGQLGDNTLVSKSVPVQVVGYALNPHADFSQIVTARYHSCGLKTNGTVYCWGEGTSGRLGDNTQVSKSVPAQVHGVGDVGFLTDVVEVAIGTNHSCARKAAGTVYCWGYNGVGQLGDNTLVSKSVPVQVHGVGDVGFLTDVTQLASSGSDALCALKADQTMYCWGSNTYGFLGDNTTVNKSVPVQVKDVNGVDFLGGILKIAAGYYNTCAIKSDNTLYCWGYNGVGQLGDNTTVNKYIPIQVHGVSNVGFLTDVSDVSIGLNYTCAVKTLGSVYCWGSGVDGKLGDNTAVSKYTPVQVKGVGNVGFLAGVSQVFANFYNVCALTINSDVYCWGYGANGQLGDNTLVSKSVPVQVHGEDNIGFLTNVSNISEGAGEHVCAVKTSGTVYCWGSAGYGQLGNPYYANKSTPTPVVDYVVSGDLLLSVLQSSGTYTSSIFDLSKKVQFIPPTLTGTIPTGTTFMLAIRVGNTPTPDETWTTLSNVTSGADLSTLSGNRYLQYVATFTADSSQTLSPTLQDISIPYVGYISVPQTLISSSYNTNSTANVFARLAWAEQLAAGTDVQYQVRTSADGVAWGEWIGPNGTSTYFTEPAGEAMPTAITDTVGDHYVQYKLTLSSDGVYTPTVSDIILTYVLNATPEFDPEQSVTATQIASSTDSNWGKVVIQYAVRDADGDTGSLTPGYITPTFEYNTGAGWTAIDPATLRPEDSENKLVSTISYTPYDAVWDAKTQIPEVYTTSMQIRVNVNDNEPANNIGQSTSNSLLIDTKVPVVAVTLLLGDTGSASYSVSDNSLLQYRLSNNADVGSDGTNNTAGQWVDIQATSTTASTSWMLPSISNPTVYIEGIDIYGNSAINFGVAPAQPSNFDLKDVSNVLNGEYREFISWKTYTATTSATFGRYELYRSTDGVGYTLRNTITDAAVNYHNDLALSTTTTYYYRIKTIDSDGDVSAWSSIVSDLPDGQGGTDVTAPRITSVTLDETQSTWAKITVVSDELTFASVEYAAEGDTAYSLSATDGSIGTEHTIVLDDLLPNTSYTFRVVVHDVLNNEIVDDNAGVGYPVTTIGGPIISDVAVQLVDDKNAGIVWNTNEDSDSTVVYATNVEDLANDTNVITVLDTAFIGGDGPLYQHKITLPDLAARTTYFFYVQSSDVDSNVSVDKNALNFYSFSTSYDTKAPVITAVTTPVLTKNAIVVLWKTDELSNSQIAYGTASSTYTTLTDVDTTQSIVHAQTISGLTEDTTYHFVVKSSDTAGNLTTSQEYTAKTTAKDEIKIVTIGGGAAPVVIPPQETKDTTAPTISNVTVTETTAFGATVTFDTNEPTVAFVRYGKDTGYGYALGSENYATHHTAVITGLRMGAEYHYQIKAIDKVANEAVDTDKTFSTKYLSEPDKDLVTLEDIKTYEQVSEDALESILPSIRPPFVEEPRVVEVTENTATIRWRTNINAYAGIVYAEANAYNPTSTKPYTEELSQATTKEKEHTMTLVGLQPNTQYHFMVRSFSLPQIVGVSQDMTFTTKAAKVSARIINVKNTSFTVVWNTEDAASTIVEYKNLKTGEIQRKIDNDKKIDHEVLVERLLPATSYEVTVFGYNEKGNLIEGGAPIAIATSRDVVAPKISNFKVDGALVPGRTDRIQTVITWTTDEASDSTIYYQEGSSAVSEFANKAAVTDTYTQNHTIILSSLKPGTIYQMKVESVDTAGNKATFGPRTIITPQKGESIFDVIFKNFEETFKFLRGAGQ